MLACLKYLRSQPGQALRIDEAAERLAAAVKHHVDVSAVVEMVRQLDADPNALELIKTYPETVRVAAWLHYIDTLGASLQTAQTRLGRAYAEGSMAYVIESYKQQVDDIRAELDAVLKASGQSGLRAV